MSSTTGTLFRVTTFGESHGGGVGAVIDGCPARLALSESDIQAQLDRRRPGQSALTTPRDESDTVSILSGVENGMTLGTPVALVIPNRNQRPGDYGNMLATPRPSHADFVYHAKYGIRSSSGGGRASARETAARVAAGAVAEKYLREKFKVSIVAWVSSIGAVDASDQDNETLSREQVDRNIVRCPDENAAAAMEKIVSEARDAGDSVGGIVTCVCRSVPPGWGEPVFEKLEARLAQAMMSIPATKGFEIGSGFGAARMLGSQHNDMFVQKQGRLGTSTNRSGGVQGGISNGEQIVFKVAFKPPATISKPQETADFEGRIVKLEAKGRHDPCVLPRAVPVVEAMAALVLADAALLQQSRM